MVPKLLKELLNLFESESFNWWAMNQITVEQVLDFSSSLENKLKDIDFKELVKCLETFKIINIFYRFSIITVAGKEKH